MTDPNIESLLRKAPQPRPPAGLKPQLEADITLPPAPRSRRIGQTHVLPFWRRWVPALAFGLLFLMSFVLLAVQTSQMLQLRRENSTLQAEAAQLDALRAQQSQLQEFNAQTRQLEQLQKDQLELQQLRAEVEQSRARNAELVQLRAERERLQTALATARAQAAAAGPAEPDPFAEARDKARSVSCINNLKQIGLAARIWSNDNGEILPADFLSMSNELRTPKVLVCPADTNRADTKAQTWAEFNPQNVTYEILCPGVKEQYPNAIFARCPIHGHVNLVTGEVHQRVAPDQIRQVDGRQEFNRSGQP